MESLNLHLAPMDSGWCPEIKRPNLTANYLARCVFSFARALLWDGYQISTSEKRRSLRILSNYLQHHLNSTHATLVLCERVQLETLRVRIPVLGSDLLLNPSAWFSETLTQNGSHLESWYRRVIQARTQVSGFRKEDTLLCLQYLAYVQKPSRVTFLKGRKRLLDLQAYNTLDVYYRAVLLLNYLR